MKKIIAMLLALMLLAVPFAGTAETTGLDIAALFAQEQQVTEISDPYTEAVEAGRRVYTTISVKELADSLTGDATVDGVINDLLGALAITTYTQNDETFFAIGMKQASGEIADLLNIGFATEDGTAYVSSNLLGGTIALTLDEVQPFLERMADMLVLMGMFTEEDVAQFKAELPEVFESLKAEIENAMASVPTQEIDYASLDFSAITDVLNPILERVETSEVTMQPRNCDPAVSVKNVTITGEEMKALILSYFRFVQANPAIVEQATYLYDSYMYGYSGTFNAMTGEMVEVPNYSELMAEEIAQMEQEIVIEGDTTLSIYFDEAEAPVYAEIRLPEQNATDAEAVAETVTHTYVPTITYTRLTMNDSTAHSVVVIADTTDITANFVDKGAAGTLTFAVGVEGETKFNAVIDMTDRSADNLTAFDMVIDMTVVDDSQYDFEYNAETGEYETVWLDPVTTQITLKITSDTYVEGVDFTSALRFTVGVNGVEYVTIGVDSASSEPGASIKDSTVAHPGAMSEGDFANWFVGVLNSLQTWLYSAMELLPASVLNLMY